jgi:hypothetical protein
MLEYYILYYWHVFQPTPITVSTAPGMGTVETKQIFFFLICTYTKTKTRGTQMVLPISR